LKYIGGPPLEVLEKLSSMEQLDIIEEEFFKVPQEERKRLREERMKLLGVTGVVKCKYLNL
jgi:hypothetical protein